MSVDSFKLVRQLDGLVYLFEQEHHPSGLPSFKRRDGDHWIVRHPDWGWVAWDFATLKIHGRPWDIPANAQPENWPPACIWVSRKGAKSFVYDLRHIAKDA